ncbi:GYF domain containing protein [Fragilaria crotonensis]|nr:GYF domain containing protein [Fragilaria crotonensis]
MPPKGKGGPAKSVRFSSGIKTKKKDVDDDNDGDDNVVTEINRPKKRPRTEEHFQHDEDDEIEEWVNDEDDGVLPSERDLVNAKRNRRLKRQGQDLDDDDDDEDDDTNINYETSLLAENSDNDDIPVEPFNMKAESTDGSGYFDGDTYIFRKAKETEPDAWLDSLDEGDKKEPRTFAKPKVSNNEGQQKDDDMDDWTKEELYSRILPLVSDSETILQALVRYGNLIKRLPKERLAPYSRRHYGDGSDQADPFPHESRRVVQWEYKGNQDGEIHGPYTTQDMLGWTQAGYFIGPQAVQIRTVSPGPATQASTQEELLSDLMDDDDDEDGDRKAPVAVRGEWVSSNDVNFLAYS